ncbi:Rpa1ap [Orobanche minor]
METIIPDCDTIGKPVELSEFGSVPQTPVPDMTFAPLASTKNNMVLKIQHTQVPVMSDLQAFIFKTVQRVFVLLFNPHTNHLQIINIMGQS